MFFPLLLFEKQMQTDTALSTKPVNLSFFLLRLALNEIPHFAPKTTTGKTQILKNKKKKKYIYISFNVITLISPRAHVLFYLR